MDHRFTQVEDRKEYDRTLLRGSFSAFMTRREVKLLESITKNLFPEGIPSYLDFACGAGRILAHLETNAQASYGIDISQSMIEVARKRSRKSDFYCVDITRDHLNGLGPFHLATAFRFFGKAQHEQRKLVFAKLYEMLVEGGYLIFNNHRNPWSAISVSKRMGNFLDDYADLSYRKIRRYLKEANFKIVRTYGIGGWLLMPRMNKHSICNSKLIQWVEPVSLNPLVGPFCPDMIIVAQKIRSTS